MSDVAIRVEGLGKQYRLGGKQERYSTLRDQFRKWTSLPKLLRRANRQAKSTPFWALKDVSFEVKQGEVVGIIGRNGAGKSTLLKILSRITEPTEGGADIHGRVGSLLEVGTGFHPELTGRENVFLNGAIMGMKRVEIVRKFDEIVAFAEVEKFIDTPVKHYSSGMYMRLAFSVAAHLEPDILVVDEVLAVGDAGFQKKCLGKLGDAAEVGRTVLFVSHNTSQIQRLCNRAVLLSSGRVIDDGHPNSVIAQYLTSGTFSPLARTWALLESAPGDDIARLRSVRAVSETMNDEAAFDIRRSIRIEVEYVQLRTNARPTVSIHLYDDQGVCLLCSNDFINQEWWRHPRRPGLVRATCQIPGNFLAEGQVFVLVALCSYNPDHIHAVVPDAVSFMVADSCDGGSVRGPYAGTWPGVVRPWLQWEGLSLGPDPSSIAIDPVNQIQL